MMPSYHLELLLETAATQLSVASGGVVVVGAEGAYRVLDLTTFRVTQSCDARLGLGEAPRYLERAVCGLRLSQELEEAVLGREFSKRRDAIWEQWYQDEREMYLQNDLRALGDECIVLSPEEETEEGSSEGDRRRIERKIDALTTEVALVRDQQAEILRLLRELAAK